jgi:hypothetical protein
MAKTRRRLRFATEGAAIVASILVAFAIDAWWDGRQLLAEEQEILIGLEEEFEGDARLVDQTLERSLRARGDLQRFLALSPEELLSPSLALSFASAYEPFIRTYTVAPSVGFLHATISSGKLAIIRDAELRAALARFDGLQSDVSEVTWYTNELNLRAAERLGEIEEIRAVLSRESELTDDVFDRRTLSATTVRRMLDDPELMSVATAKLRYWDGYFFEVRALRQNIDEVLSLLEASRAPRN